MSRDPIGYEGSKWNLYEYVSSNPTNRIDPDGLNDGAMVIIGGTDFEFQPTQGRHGSQKAEKPIIIGPITIRPKPPSNAKPPGGYDPGRKYPYQCPKETKKPCDHDKFMDMRWRAGFDVYFWYGKPNGSEADGKTINAFAHCLAACRIHRDMPECDYNWEQSEWKNGKPKDFMSDLDIRNNKIGRECANKGKQSCWDCCLSKAKNGGLWCGDSEGLGIPVKCKGFSL